MTWEGSSGTVKQCGMQLGDICGIVLSLFFYSIYGGIFGLVQMIEHCWVSDGAAR